MTEPTEPLNLISLCEQTVRAVFEKRFRGREMQYEAAREAVWLERELVEAIATSIRQALRK